MSVEVIIVAVLIIYWCVLCFGIPIYIIIESIKHNRLCDRIQHGTIMYLDITEWENPWGHVKYHDEIKVLDTKDGWVKYCRKNNEGVFDETKPEYDKVGYILSVFSFESLVEKIINV